MNSCEVKYWVFLPFVKFFQYRKTGTAFVALNRITFNGVNNLSNKNYSLCLK